MNSPVKFLTNHNIKIGRSYYRRTHRALTVQPSNIPLLQLFPFRFDLIDKTSPGDEEALMPHQQFVCPSPRVRLPQTRGQTIIIEYLH